MTYRTPVYNLTAPDDGDPIWSTAAALRNTVDTVEIALRGMGVVPPDLAAFLAAVTAAGGGAAQAAVTALPSITWASGWSLSSVYLQRLGFGRVSIDIRANRTGAAIASGTTGDIADSLICTLPAPWRPRARYAALTSIVNTVAAGYIDQAGAVNLAAFAPGYTLNTGSVFGLFGEFAAA